MLLGENPLCSSQKDLPKLPRLDHTAAMSLGSPLDRAGLASLHPDKPGQTWTLLLKLHLPEHLELLLCDPSVHCQPNLHLTCAGCEHVEEQQHQARGAAWEMFFVHLALQLMQYFEAAAEMLTV